MQRSTLTSKGYEPDVLVMTATPIPRTLALTVYGDLDVSVIDEMPPGRSPIVTRLYFESRRREAYQFIEEELGKGRQVYVVYPLVEETEKSDLKAATEMAAHLQKDIFPGWKVGLLHGRMKADEKEAVMAAFKSGETHILVSTTVIEVGVDVPNADGHGDRTSRTVRSGAASSAPGQGGQGRPSVLLHPDGAADVRRRGAGAAELPLRARTTASRSPKRTSGCAVRASSSARASPVCRTCARRTSSATRTCSKRRRTEAFALDPEGPRSCTAYPLLRELLAEKVAGEARAHKRWLIFSGYSDRVSPYEFAVYSARQRKRNDHLGKSDREHGKGGQTFSAGAALLSERVRVEIVIAKLRIRQDEVKSLIREQEQIIGRKLVDLMQQDDLPRTTEELIKDDEIVTALAEIVARERDREDIQNEISAEQTAFKEKPQEGAGA